MTSIAIETGSEGPKHDPYGWEEVTVTRSNGDEVTLHSGLGSWVAVNGERFAYAQPITLDLIDGEKEEWRLLCKKFEEVAGCSPDAARKAYGRVRYTCSKCGAFDDVEEMQGFPGETLAKCRQCGCVVYCDFNEAAII